MTENVQSHVGVIHLKVLDLGDSEKFYDHFYQVMRIDRKEKNEDYIGYWGAFGVILTEQKNHLINVPNENKTAISKLSIFVSQKEIVENVYKEMSKQGYSIIWEPKSFDYSKGYYSTCLADPDDNHLEVYFVDTTES